MKTISISVGEVASGEKPISKVRIFLSQNEKAPSPNCHKVVLVVKTILHFWRSISDWLLYWLWLKKFYKCCDASGGIWWCQMAINWDSSKNDAYQNLLSENILNLLRLQICRCKSKNLTHPKPCIFLPKSEINNYFR